MNALPDQNIYPRHNAVLNKNTAPDWNFVPDTNAVPDHNMAHNILRVARRGFFLCCISFQKKEQGQQQRGGLGGWGVEICYGKIHRGTALKKQFRIRFSLGI